MKPDIPILIIVTMIMFSNVSCNLLSGIEAAKQAMLKAQERIRGITSHRYSSTFKPTSLRIVGLDIGIGKGYFDIKNLFSYTHQMYKGKDILFLLEQNGYGAVYAAFNGRSISCSGLAQDRFKKCRVPASFKPWSGRFSVNTFGRHGSISAGFTMSAEAFCPVRGLQGDMCKDDIDECQKFKGQRICSWIDGCVNTYGSFRCKCPPGYKVSPKDFRLCDAMKPKISSPPKDILVQMDTNVTFDCKSDIAEAGITKWYIGSKLIAFRHRNGHKVLQPNRMTLFNNGSLYIRGVKYGDIGDFTCQVIVGREGAYVIHKLKVESKPIVEAGIYVDGKPRPFLNFNSGQALSLRCKSLGIPKPVARWMKNGKPVTVNEDVKINKLQEPTGIAGVKSIEVLELYFKSFQTRHAGEYACEAENKYGTSTASVKLVQ